jgi:hypothetical protein
MEAQRDSCKLLNLSAEGGTRTRTAPASQRILSPLCLPFHHPGQIIISITYITLSAIRSGNVAQSLLVGLAGPLLGCAGHQARLIESQSTFIIRRPTFLGCKTNGTLSRGIGPK